MDSIALKILIGSVVGTLIGLTGLGGGVLLLPLLIFGLRVPAIIAVGSDAAFNFLTKIPSGIVHLRKGTVRRKVVLALASGSIPGSIQSSASAKAMYSPFARRIPVFLALLTPPFSVCITVKRLSELAIWFKISPLSSVDPSLTAIISKSGKPCLQTESMHCLM